MKSFCSTLAFTALLALLLFTQPACERLDPNVIFPEYMAKKAEAEKKEQAAPAAGENSEAPTFFPGQSIQ